MFFKPRVSWFDNQAVDTTEANPEKIECLRVLPFIVLHLACFAVFWVEFSAVAVSVAVVLSLLRMFAITGFYHRYFAHKAFKTSRAIQFIFVFLAASAAQRGSLWWASHRHAHSDHPEGSHSPKQHGFFWGEIDLKYYGLKILSALGLIRDLRKVPVEVLSQKLTSK